MFNTSEFRGIVADAIRVRDAQGDELYDFIKRNLRRVTKERGIPAVFSEDQVKSGGLFAPKYPLLIIQHPNPPTRFFYIGITVNQNIVSFPLLGESKQNTAMNKKKALEAEGKFIAAALTKPDEFILQQEYAWQREIMDAIDSLLTP